MRLTIDNKENKYSPDFIVYLIKCMRLYYNNLVDAKQIKRWDKYFESQIKWKRKLSTKAIIISGFRNLLYRIYKDEYVIEINTTVKVPNFDEYNLSAMCKLIDQGNLDMSPYPIFTKTFNKIIEDFDELYNNYVLGIRIK